MGEKVEDLSFKLEDARIKLRKAEKDIDAKQKECDGFEKANKQLMANIEENAPDEYPREESGGVSSIYGRNYLKQRQMRKDK